MKEQLIIFDTAQLAKKKGFDAWCYAWYYEGTLVSWQANIMSEVVGVKRNYKNFQYKDVKFNDEDSTYAAPTQSLLHKWLREKHYLTVRVHRDYDGWAYMIEEFKSGNKMIKGGSAEMPDYEVEFEKGLQEALKLIKS